MTGHDHGSATFPRLFKEQVGDLDGVTFVERARRLVSEDDRWIVNQCPRNPDSLDFPTRDRFRLGVYPISQPNPMEHDRSFPLRVSAADTPEL